MKELTTIDSILEYIENAVSEKQPLSPAIWLDAASKLNALLGSFDDEFIQAEMAYRKLRASYLEQGKSAAHGETVSKASPEYELFLKYKARKDQIERLIQISKKRTDQKFFDI